jgi:acetyl-CoA carboxylase carboxyltransferase component
MIDKTGIMHITGPSVIKAVTGEEVTSESLGGARGNNAKSGNAHFFAKDEEECFSQVKKLLGYLPSNNMEEPPVHEIGDDPYRLSPRLREIVPTNPNKSYHVHEVLVEVLDGGDFFEVHEQWGTNIVTGYGRIGGQTVGIIANQASKMAGCLDIDCSDKASRFIRHCDAFNVPIVSFVDVPGYLPGTSQEWGGIIRHGAKLLYAYSEATVPLITVVLRKAYGGAYLGMCSKALGADTVLAWPQAEIAVMGAEGAASIVFRRDIEKAEDQQQMRQQKIEEYRKAFANPYQAARRGLVDRVILPEETRREIYLALKSNATKRESLPRKKHSVMPQ